MRSVSIREQRKHTTDVWVPGALVIQELAGGAAADPELRDDLAVVFGGTTDDVA